MQKEGRFRKDGQDRVMTFAPRPSRIIALGRSFLCSSPLKDRRIQIQVKSLLGTGEHRQKPTPKRTPKGLDVSLGEAEKEIAHRIGAGKTNNAQNGVQGAVRAEPISMGKAAG